jgi:hypothetical protein
MINHQISLNPHWALVAFAQGSINPFSATTERRAGSYGHLTGIVSAAGKLLCRCAILDGEVAPSAEA